MSFIRSKSFNFILITSLFLFYTSLWASPLKNNLDGKPRLDHSWRKGHIPPPPALKKTFESNSVDYQILPAFRAYDNGIWYEPGTNPRVFQEIDVLHYTIDAIFDLGASPYPDNANLAAEVIISAQAKAATLTEIVVDLFDNITVDSIQLNGEILSDPDNYTRTDNKIWITLSDNKKLAPAELFEIIVDYNRVYGGTYQGLGYKTHGVSDTPAIYTITQPYHSPGWRPCFDVPSDKATTDIYITCPDWMTTASNGLLQTGYPIDNGDGTKTAFWKESYPIYTSVVSVAMTDYTTWTDTYVSPLDNSTMPLFYCAFPEDSAKAMVDFAISKDALEFFAQIYGEYPFINEKYGVAETPNTHGSMEHQTMTSLTIRATQNAVNWDVIVHEAAHQWFGDALTCDTWNHVWLHEGFATYSEILFNEFYVGDPPGAFMAVEYDDGLYDGDLSGTVYTPDDDLDNPFGPVGAKYEKGAWVLHMLRHFMGDTAFFTAVSSYYQEHIYSTAVTSDLKEAMENEFGSSLTDYFDQWLYTPYRPVYSAIYENSTRVGGYLVDINLLQTQAHSVLDIAGVTLRDYYIMPVDFTVHYTDETTETFTVNNNQRSQHFQLLTTKEPDYTVFDEGKNLLKVTASEETLDNDGIFIDGDNSTVFGDNPCTGGETENCDDNCAYTPNGHDLGSCVRTEGSVTFRSGTICTDNSTCEPNEICQKAQEDYNNNGTGDVCECYSDIDNNGNVGLSDLGTMKVQFGTFGCTPLTCLADIDDNGNVGLSDLGIMKVQFGTFGCPVTP